MITSISKANLAVRQEAVGAWKLVPVKPTDAMMQAGLYQSSHDMQWEDLYSAWKDMLAAAPNPLAPEHSGPDPAVTGHGWVNRDALFAFNAKQALAEIAGSKPLTATPQQMIGYLQRIARLALSGDWTPDEVSAQDQPPRAEPDEDVIAAIIAEHAHQDIERGTAEMDRHQMSAAAGEILRRFGGGEDAARLNWLMRSAGLSDRYWLMRLSTDSDPRAMIDIELRRAARGEAS